jgi:flagellar FliL protein
MSDEPPPLKKEAAAPVKSSKAVLGLLLLNLGGSGFIVFKLLTAHPAEGAPKEHAAATKSSLEVTGPVIALDPFVVNLDEPGISRYLKVTLQVELLPAPDVEQVLVRSKQLIRDAILGYLSGLHLKDTLGAEAKEKIRQDLMAKINKLVGADKVRRLFFQDFVVQ